MKGTRHAVRTNMYGRPESCSGKFVPSLVFGSNGDGVARVCRAMSMEAEALLFEDLPTEDDGGQPRPGGWAVTDGP
jgi:hypothetical protein